jgi:hypothetical protein
MLFVERSRIPEPSSLRSPLAWKERERAREFFSSPRLSKAEQLQRLQMRFEWNGELIESARGALMDLFRAKCGFCEQLGRTENPLEVGHFRPYDELHDAGTSSPSSSTAYWWLAYEWENLYLMCKSCRERSRFQFPIGMRRAASGAIADQLRSEQPLLLDPCLLFEPTHVALEPGRSTGLLVARETDGTPTRASATIELFGLNRTELVFRRMRAWQALNELLPRFKGKPRPKQLARIRAMLDPAAEFSGLLSRSLRRSLDAAGYSGVRRELLQELLVGLMPSLELGETAVESPVAQTAGTGAQPRRNRRRPPRLPRPAPLRAAAGWYIRRVEIKNFRTISKLSLAIPRGHSGPKGPRTGWKVLLGENGAGKSSLLEAIVFAFMGPTFIESEGITGRSLLRKTKAKYLSAEGHVRIHWVDEREPSLMRFTRQSITFVGPRPPKDVTLRAYGPTRNMAGGRYRARNKSKPREVANLFDPFVPVCDVDEWYRSIRSSKVKGSAALSLKDILSLPSRTRIRQVAGKMEARVNGVDVTLGEMSAGYQSVVTLAADIMAAVLGQARDLRHALGIVVIDELDAHLHPRWKMEIVERLRRTFPLIQFIVTTHEPLCLRGLRDDEIAVMRRRDRGQVELITDLPPIEGLRVDQLLTSPLFGLHSTLDPSLDRDFRDYYALLPRTDLSDDETAKLAALRSKVATVGVLGNSRRDQLVYEVIDKYLAAERRKPTKKAFEIPQELRARVIRAWNNSEAIVQLPT